MIKPKVLKRILSLKKSHLSDEACVKVILDLCIDPRDPQQASACETIVAFFATQWEQLEKRLASLEAEYAAALRKWVQERDILLMERKEPK